MKFMQVLHDEGPDSWREAAVCKGHTRLFFPRRAERPEARARREAKADALCGQCPVIEACRAFARNEHEYGFWGGESEEDRYVLGFTVSAPIGIRTRLDRLHELKDMDTF
jgi:WhiB family transcriptional regulator, redox-sensing transcriptional regulator